VPASEAGGEKLVIVAAVLDPACAPAGGATTTLWHTDATGLYGPGTGSCCYFGGTVRSDQNGRFRLESIRPGQYPTSGAPPAHIHLEVEHPSGRLETEIVFAGAPAENVLPIVLESINLPQGGRYWYGEAVLVLRR
jgi:protocatechuate 3,4-dioxygenase beta subunit